MGNRFTYGFVNPGGDVLYLYSHWGGYEWNEKLANAMRAAGVRREDTYYANRIMVSQLIGEDWNKNNGYGFSVNEVFDEEHGFVPVIDWSRQQVSVYLHNDMSASLGDLLITFPIAEFISDPHTCAVVVEKLVSSRVSN